VRALPLRPPGSGLLEEKEDGEEEGEEAKKEEILVLSTTGRLKRE